jgi:hypothetical protein
MSFTNQQPTFSALVNSAATTNSGRIGEAASTSVPLAVTLPTEVAALKTAIGAESFAALSGEKETVRPVLAALTSTSANAEVKKIADETLLLDIYALTQLLLRDKALPISRSEVYAAIQSSIKQQLRDNICTKPTPCVEKNLAECFTSQSPTVIALVVVSVLAVIAILVAILTAIFRRKCQTAPGSGYPR